MWVLITPTQPNYEKQRSDVWKSRSDIIAEARDDTLTHTSNVLCFNVFPSENKLCPTLCSLATTVSEHSSSQPTQWCCFHFHTRCDHYWSFCKFQGQANASSSSISPLLQGHRFIYWLFHAINFKSILIWPIYWRFFWLLQDLLLIMRFTVKFNTN